MIERKFNKKDEAKLVITTIKYIFALDLKKKVTDIHIPDQQKESFLGKVLV